MGSDSDLSVISQAADTLAAFDVACDMRILSAHRVPQMVAELAGQARKQGYQVIIAGAGMAAHLPGLIAAYTTLPVIGVPLVSKVLDGQDALYSIVQMPTGVPVATVGIGAAKNAALLALQIIGLSDKRVASALQAEKERMAQAVLEKDMRLQAVGRQAYVSK